MLLSKDGDKSGDSAHVIGAKALEKGVLAMPGTAFMPSGKTTSYARASFSVSTAEEMDEGLQRLRQVVLAAREEADAVI